MRGNPNVHPSRRFGHVPDPTGHCVTPVHHMPGMRAAMAAPLPRTVDHRSAVKSGPGIHDQLKTSSCVGQATDGAIETRLFILGTPVEKRSPICIYDAARCIDREVLADGSFAPLRDEGSMPNQAMRGLSLWGVCPYADRPTADATINDEPNMAELQDARAFRLSGAYSINTRGAARILQMKQVLAAGHLIPFATFVDTKFQAWQPSQGPLGLPDYNDPSGGGHYLYACGYDTTLISGITAFYFANSWGIFDWGIEGFGEADEDFANDATDLYVADVHILGADGQPMRRAA